MKTAARCLIPQSLQHHDSQSFNSDLCWRLLEFSYLNVPIEKVNDQKVLFLWPLKQIHADLLPQPVKEQEWATVAHGSVTCAVCIFYTIWPIFAEMPGHHTAPFALVLHFEMPWCPSCRCCELIVVWCNTVIQWIMLIANSNTADDDIQLPIKYVKLWENTVGFCQKTTQHPHPELLFVAALQKPWLTALLFFFF